MQYSSDLRLCRNMPCKQCVVPTLLRNVSVKRNDLTHAQKYPLPTVFFVSVAQSSVSHHLPITRVSFDSTDLPRTPLPSSGAAYDCCPCSQLPHISSLA